MKRSKFSEEQIAYALRQAESGTPAGIDRPLHAIGTRCPGRFPDQRKDRVCGRLRYEAQHRRRTTWASVPTAGHPDNHVIKFYAGSSMSILVGNDGGLFKTTNGGSTWSSLNKGLAIMQFYRLGISKTNPNIMISGAQDNGNAKYNAGVFSNITNADGMKGFVDWSNSNVIYAGVQNGNFYRSTNGGGSFTPINTPSSGAWVWPWAQDPAAAKTIYAGTDKVYRSTNQGTTWVAISGTLAGVPRFTVLEVAPSNSKVIYAGNGNKLYRTSNGGAAWTDVSASLPGPRTISRTSPSTTPIPIRPM